MKWAGSVGLALVMGLGGGYAIRAATAPAGRIVTLPNGRHVTFPSGTAGRSAGGFTGPGGFGAIGKVAAVNGSTLEVQGASGQVAVKLSSTTTITRSVKTAASAIAVGLCVTAVGPANSLGTVSATRVVVTGPVNGSCTAGVGFGGRGGAGG